MKYRKTFFFIFFGIIIVWIIFSLIQIYFSATRKTASFSIPSKSAYKLGEIFPLDIQITGMKTPVNAVQADIAFDPQSLEVVALSTNHSFATIFIQKEIDNTKGFVRLTGGLPNPGFSADQGTFGTIFFKGKKPGLTTMRYLPTSLILANNAKGENVLKDYAQHAYLILPEAVSKNESEQQRNMVKSKVLGVSTDNATQMTFYDNKEVMGVTTTPIVQEQESTNIVTQILIFLNRIIGR